MAIWADDNLVAVDRGTREVLWRELGPLIRTLDGRPSATLRHSCPTRHVPWCDIGPPTRELGRMLSGRRCAMFRAELPGSWSEIHAAQGASLGFGASG